MEKCNIKALAVAIGALWAFSVLLLAWMAAFGWGREMVTLLASLYLGYAPLFWAESLARSGLSSTAPLPGRSSPGSIIWSPRNKICENDYDYYLLLMALQESRKPRQPVFPLAELPAALHGLGISGGVVEPAPCRLGGTPRPGLANGLPVSLAGRPGAPFLYRGVCPPGAPRAATPRARWPKP